MPPIEVDPSLSPPESVPPAPRSLGEVWLWPLAAGLVAGLVAWLGGEATLNVIRPVTHAVNSKGIILQIADRWEGLTTEARNAALAFTLLGGAVGVWFGLAGGLTRRSIRRGLGAGLVGGLVGVAGSAGLAAAVLTPFNSYRYQNPDEASRDLLLPLLVHGSIWSVAGLAGGLAFALGAGVDRPRVAKVAGSGLMGALIGTVLFELLGVLVISEFDGGQLVAATSLARLVARLAVSLGGAVGVSLALTDRKRSPVRRPGGSGGAPGG